jgi:aminoglycoside phosphotransferase (APT) family kinase protein
MTLADSLRCIRACRAAFLAPSLEIPIELADAYKENFDCPKRPGACSGRKPPGQDGRIGSSVRPRQYPSLYEWLESKSGKSMPQGPAVWICGDCHVGNIGPLADLKGRVEIQIRDLDQTVIGDPAHDLVRLALFLATAARGSDCPGITLVQMLEQMVEGYGAV